MEAIYNSVFGDKIKDMFEIQFLATIPAKQGRGYGTALVKTVNKMVRRLLGSIFSSMLRITQADERGRATYLLTIDAYRFYETVGYKLVGEDWLGVDNPNWTSAPVPVRVVSLLITCKHMPVPTGLFTDDERTTAGIKVSFGPGKGDIVTPTSIYYRLVTCQV